jgi:hypothetical protein
VEREALVGRLAAETARLPALRLLRLAALPVRLLAWLARRGAAPERDAAPAWPPEVAGAVLPVLAAKTALREVAAAAVVAPAGVAAPAWQRAPAPAAVWAAAPP